MLIPLVKILFGVVLLIGGAEWLVRGASSLAVRAGITPLVVGLTVVAFGTSSPELVVGIQAAVTDRGAVALGTVVGSNICNIVLILGLAALVRPMATHREVLRLDLPIMILVTVVFTAVALLSPSLTRWHGAALLTGIVVYSAFTIHLARRHAAGVEARVDTEHVPSGMPGWRMALFLAAGPLLLVTGSDLVLDGAVAGAERLGVSQAVVGLTVVAVGGSLPELATSLAAAMKGKADIAAGNVIGSNIFNILCILGAAALARPIPLRGGDTIGAVDLAMMNLAAIALFPMMSSGMRLGRVEGAAMLAVYVVYVVSLFVRT